VAWYLYPDEGHNADGKHTTYLSAPDKWRHLDPKLFDALAGIVSSDRSVSALEQSRVLKATFANEMLTTGQMEAPYRDRWRLNWSQRVLATLSDCDLVFADPDNGLTDDQPKRRREKHFGKRMPLSEVRSIVADRTAVIYHHNTRFKGGHDVEVTHWSKLFGADTLAVRSNSFQCRTFFVVKPDAQIAERVRQFCEVWSNHNVWLHNIA
jgi:hypothetical protein